MRCRVSNHGIVSKVLANFGRKVRVSSITEVFRDVPLWKSRTTPRLENLSLHISLNHSRTHFSCCTYGFCTVRLSCQRDNNNLTLMANPPVGLQLWTVHSRSKFNWCTTRNEKQNGGRYWIKETRYAFPWFYCYEWIMNWLCLDNSIQCVPDSLIAPNHAALDQQHQTTTIQTDWITTQHRVCIRWSDRDHAVWKRGDIGARTAPTGSLPVYGWNVKWNVGSWWSSRGALALQNEYPHRGSTPQREGVMKGLSASNTWYVPFEC